MIKRYCDYKILTTENILRPDYAEPMSGRTVDWTASDANRVGEGLRQRKKRLMHQQLSDTATELFLERGFDAVRVADVAEACGVSEKTVFNYFPSKESLLLDRFADTMPVLRTRLADRGLSPVDAVLRVLADELRGLVSSLEQQHDRARAIARIVRFRELVDSSASLRAYQRDAADQLAATAAEVLAERAGVDPADPEPQIAAAALVGLWHVHFKALRKYLDGTRTPKQVERAVTADVERAARLLARGLPTFDSAAWQ